MHCGNEFTTIFTPCSFSKFNVVTQLKGIVFHTIRFKDTQFIVRVFTRELGLKSFIIRSGKSAKTNILPMIQPLSMVEMEVNYKENQKLLQPKSLRLAVNYATIPFDPLKSAIALFIDEILHKTIADDYHNDQLYTFLEFALLSFDQMESSKNFHIWFLIELTKYYGFYPQIIEESHHYFDLMQGESSAHTPQHRMFLEGLWKQKWLSFLDIKLEEAEAMALNGAERKYLLELSIQYIQLHLENAREIKSLDVLHEVFSG